MEETLIGVSEIERKAGERGVSVGMIERDYVLSKMLWAFSSIDFLRNNFVFKGGTALRKFYFPDWRYSEDLDFSVTREVRYRYTGRKVKFRLFIHT